LISELKAGLAQREKLIKIQQSDPEQEKDHPEQKSQQIGTRLPAFLSGKNKKVLL